ncbi:MAG: putative rane protein [Gemmatimonadetes bacterium]|nr:putative rane protein [Gemmatimonadota bacterium]
MASTAYVAAPEDKHAVPSGVSVTDLLLLCMALVWGFNFIVVKYATGVFAPLAFNSARILLAVVVLWAIVLIRGIPSLTRRDVIGMLLLGSIGNGLYQILWVEGLALTRASDAALLVAASPVAIEILGAFRGQERIGAKGMAGIALSLLGMGFVVFGASSSSVHESSLVGDAWILGSVICWAFYSVGLRPYTERIDGITLSAVTMTGGVVPMLICAAPSLIATNWGAVTLTGWGAVGYSGIFALVLAYLFWYRGISVLGPTRASMYSNLQPLVAMAAAWLLLNEVPHSPQLLGGLCIICGLLMTRLPSRKTAVVGE